MAITFAQLRALNTTKLATAADTAVTVGRDMESRAGEITDAARQGTGSDFWGGADADAQNALLNTFPPPLNAAGSVFKSSAGTIDGLVTELDGAKADAEAAILSYPLLKVSDDGSVSWPPSSTPEEADRLRIQAQELSGKLTAAVERANTADEKAAADLAKNDLGSGQGPVQVRLPDGSVYLATGDGDNQVRLTTDPDGNVVAEVDGKDLVFAPGTNLIVNSGGGNDNVDVYRSVNSGVTLNTGDGADVVTDHESTGQRTFVTGEGDDTVASTGDNRDIFSEGGADTLRSIGNGNNLASGAGDDAIDTTGGKVFAGDGNDTVRAGGHDSPFFQDLPEHATDVYGGAGDDRITGSDQGEQIVGGGGKDQILGRGGNDTISGNDGDDRIEAGDGNDRIDAGAGRDEVFGHEGDDAISGQDGDDRIEGNAGNDSIDGGTGNDEILGHEGNDTVSGHTGSDRIEGHAGDDTIDGGTENDILNGGEGNDTVTGRAGDDEVYGGEGNDTITGHEGDDEIYGGEGNDTVSGNDGNDYIDGQDGDDTITGDAGKDTIYGLDGNDTLSGGDEQDYLEGGTGSDTIDGGTGNDVVSGGRDNDTLTGGDGNDSMYAGHGQDTLNGGAGTDRNLVQDEDAVTEDKTDQVQKVEVKNADFFNIEGSEEFRDRVQADLDLYGASPNGQQLIDNLRAHVEASQNDLLPGQDDLTISEYDENNGAAHRYYDISEDGKTSSSSFDDNFNDNPHIKINPDFHLNSQDPNDLTPDPDGRPSVVLYHELSHVYDYLNSGFDDTPYSDADQPDSRPNPDGPGTTGVPNGERAAAGLPIDHDNDPATDPIPDPDQPRAVTENGLREEMGLPSRPSYGSPTQPSH